MIIRSEIRSKKIIIRSEKMILRSEIKSDKKIIRSEKC